MVEHVSAIVREEKRALISELTMYEIRRGFLELELRGLGSRKRLVGELFLRSASVVPLGGAFDIAAQLWARGRVAKPAIVVAEVDLLLVASAVRDGLTLVTADGKLARAAARLGVPDRVELLTLD